VGLRTAIAIALIDTLGQAHKCLQKILVSEGGWDIGTTDISKEMLQAVTYEELAELFGEKPCEVTFIFQQAIFLCYERRQALNILTLAAEVLHCDKLGI
jgi:hypothetical protein